MSNVNRDEGIEPINHAVLRLTRSVVSAGRESLAKAVFSSTLSVFYVMLIGVSLVVAIWG